MSDSSDNFWIGLFWGAVLCVSIYWFNKPDEVVMSEPSIGRYQVVEKASHVFLVDTTDGDVYRWQWTEKDDKTGVINWHWAQTSNVMLQMKHMDEEEKLKKKPFFSLDRIKPKS